MTRPYAMRYSRFEAVEDFLRQGWMVSIPNAAMHHHHYGIELAWLCSCPVPGGFQVEEPDYVPHPLTGGENERAANIGT
jgi:hypothetical protein